jgi:predicted signal transduction protein with EAL and GGDEF domain
VEVGLAAADQVAHALHPPFDLDGAEVHVSASVGISLLPGDAADAVELLAHADHATYAAKRAGGGAHRYVPRAPRTTSTPEDLALGTRLDRALAAGHITAHLQPVVDVSTCHVTAYEALARWLDPERGLLPPAAFLPWAERRGPIDRIRGEVVDVVCAALGTLDHLGGTPWIAINVSARELLAPGFVAGLMAAADRHAVPPDRLVVELTETAVMGDPDRATAVLAALRSTSVRVAIDDFGAGYSSMARLRTLPVDVLKIDAGLLDGVPEDEGAVAVLAALVELGRALGLSVVAEGVERPEQHEVLVDLRCPLAQGWLYGRPAPAERWHGVSAVPRPGGAVAPTP